MSVPRHEYDRNYVPIPDAPQGSMVNLDRLPADVIWALRKVRGYEAETAVNASLLADPVRAWFRYEERAAALKNKEESDG